MHLDTTTHLYNEEAERSVLAALLMDCRHVLDRYPLEPSHFYFIRHQNSVGAIKHLDQKNIHPDLITVCQELRETKLLDECGGPGWLAEVAGEIPSIAGVGYHAELVLELARRRHLHKVGRQIVQNLSDGQTSEEVLHWIDAETQKENIKGNTLWRPLNDCVQETLEQVDRAFCGQARVGLQTGLIALDRKIGGLKKENLVIVAGRPSMGKTSLGGQMALSVAKTGASVGLVSLEMSVEELTRKFLAIEGENLSVTGLTHGTITKAGWQSLTDAADMLSNLKLYILDDGHVTLESLGRKSRALKRKYGLDLLLIDYLQLLSVSKKSESRVADMSEISRSLKLLSKELKIPVVALSQLNRLCEMRTDKRPLLSDLRESGAIEQDADVAIFIYRDEIYDENSPDKGKAELLVRKNRNGPVGEVRVGWDEKRTAFFDWGNLHPNF